MDLVCPALARYCKPPPSHDQGIQNLGGTVPLFAPHGSVADLAVKGAKRLGLSYRWAVTRARGANTQVCRQIFSERARRLGIPGRARPSGTERKSQNRPAMVRFSGALFFVWQCLFLIFFVSLCGVYDVHLYKLVICVPRGLGCAMTPGRWSYHMS